MASPSEISMEATQSATEQHEIPLVRQTSIFSLTLDEFQSAVCEPGKTFGSMNMDEFLTNIWNVEESQAVAPAIQDSALSDHGHPHHKTFLTSQPSLPRQSSITLPATLCRKTVEEVWSEIHKQQQHQHPQQQLNNAALGSAPRQPTLGEMTLEDFLIKAGVVRESCTTSAAAPFQPQQPQQQYGYFMNRNIEEREAGYGGVYGYADHQQNTANGMVAGCVLAYQSYQQPPPPPQQQQQAGSGCGFSGVCYGGRAGFGGNQSVSPEGVCPSQAMENSMSHCGMGGGSCGGRKTIVDGHLEKGVERRQRRMIKNRESAARSRARKQAYTVELEAELEMLKEENARLRKQQEVEKILRRKKILEAMIAVMAPTPMKFKTLKRTSTVAW